MCDRFSFSLPKQKIIRRFGVKVPDLSGPHYNISPGNWVAVIADRQPKQLAWAVWGLDRLGKPAKHRMAVKPEAQKPSAQTIDALARRCLILADGWYVWKKLSHRSRVPHRATLKWNIPFAMAGVWRESADGSRMECAVLTVKANPLFAGMTASMPAILSLEDEKTWLDTQATPDELLPCLRPYAADKMRVFPVSVQINELEANTPELIVPALPADQFGNYVLFE